MNTDIKWFYILMVSAILVTSRNSTQNAVTPDSTTPTPISVTPTSSTVEQIEDDQIGDRVDWVVLDPAYSAEIVYETQLVPRMVRIDPEDRIYAYNTPRDAIYLIQENGELSVFFSQPGWVIECFDFDATGNLWITTGAHELYKLPKGRPLERIISDGVNRIFFFDSGGNLIAVDYYGQNKDIQLITPDGSIDTFAENLDIVKHAVGPNDEVLIFDYDGQVVQILPGGEQRIIASGFTFDSGLAVSPDGTLYVMEGFQVTEVDLQTGEKRRLNWLSDNYWNLGLDAVFDSAGHMYIYSGNEGLYKVDLQEETVEQVRNPYGNTMAMTTDPSGNVYLAYGDGLPEGATSVFLVEHGELIQIGTVPGGMPRGMASSDPNTLYVATHDPILGGSIYSVNIESGDYEPFMPTGNNLDSLVVDPSTGFVWWSIRYDQVYYLDGDGELNTVPVPPPNPDDIFLDIGVDGTVYAIIWEQRPVQPGPGPHRLYRLEENGEWLELADMSTEDPGIWWALPVVCPDGSVYAIGSVDGKTISPDRTDPCFNAVLRLEDDGTMTLIGYDLSVDTKAAICDRCTGDIVFTHYYGVYRLIRSELLFLPVVVRQGD